MGKGINHFFCGRSDIWPNTREILLTIGARADLAEPYSRWPAAFWFCAQIGRVPWLVRLNGLRYVRVGAPVRVRIYFGSDLKLIRARERSNG